MKFWNVSFFVYNCKGDLYFSKKTKQVIKIKHYSFSTSLWVIVQPFDILSNLVVIGEPKLGFQKHEGKSIFVIQITKMALYIVWGFCGTIWGGCRQNNYSTV